MRKERYIKKNRIYEKIEQFVYLFLAEKEFYHWNKSFVCVRRPKLFTEKLNYLRIYRYSNNPKITECVDKCEVKKYLKRIGKEELCAKTYGVYNNATEINWDNIPNCFVIKCNHGSGYNYICRDKNLINVKKIEGMLNGWMGEDYWKKHTELVYKNIDKKILVEEYLGEDLQTYRFCCFNGKPKVIYIATSMNGRDYFDFYNLNWQKIKMNENQGTKEFHKRPKSLEQMIKLAALLSEPFPFVRVDLYEVEGKIYFSEFTFLPAGGYFIPSPLKFNQLWGRWLKL